MKATFLLLVASATYLVNAGPVVLPGELEAREYQRYIEFPDGDGNMHVIDLEEEPDMELLAEIERNPANNQYLLFTRCIQVRVQDAVLETQGSMEKRGSRLKGFVDLKKALDRFNPTTAQSLVMNDADSIHSSNFNPANPTVVIVHGWLSNQNTDLNPVIRNAYLGRSNVNVIVMDWRRLALSGYITATTGVPAVGRGLGQFLAFLNSVTGARFDQMHLVGFSLGAHVVGNAGRELGGRAARVTGLDPAGPLWHYNSNRINQNDGVYVEAIHTDGNTLVGLGIGKVVANVDFFPNGGYNQPGCLTGICDHNRAWELFASTVTHNHLIGNRCSSSFQITWNNCRGEEFPMGNDDLNKSGSGMYRVNTGRRYPF